MQRGKPHFRAESDKEKNKSGSEPGLGEYWRCFHHPVNLQGFLTAAGQSGISNEENAEHGEGDAY